MIITGPMVLRAFPKKKVFLSLKLADNPGFDFEVWVLHQPLSVPAQLCQICAGSDSPQSRPEHNWQVRTLHCDKNMGHAPSTAGTFRKKSGRIPERPRGTLSERFLEFSSRVRLGSPKPYNSRHLRLPEHFQNSLPPSTAGSASFFRSGSGEGLSEPVMEFLAVLGVISENRLVADVW